jgi:hypothetical protein
MHSMAHAALRVQWLTGVGEVCSFVYSNAADKIGLFGMCIWHFGRSIKAGEDSRELVVVIVNLISLNELDAVSFCPEWIAQLRLGRGFSNAARAWRKCVGLPVEAHSVVRD